MAQLRTVVVLLFGILSVCSARQIRYSRYSSDSDDADASYSPGSLLDTKIKPSNERESPELTTESSTDIPTSTPSLSDSTTLEADELNDPQTIKPIPQIAVSDKMVAPKVKTSAELRVVDVSTESQSNESTTEEQNDLLINSTSAQLDSATDEVSKENVSTEVSLSEKEKSKTAGNNSAIELSDAAEVLPSTFILNSSEGSTNIETPLEVVPVPLPYLPAGFPPNRGFPIIEEIGNSNKGHPACGVLNTKIDADVSNDDPDSERVLVTLNNNQGTVPVQVPSAAQLTVIPIFDPRPQLFWY